MYYLIISKRIYNKYTEKGKKMDNYIEDYSASQSN